jgi:hypothetical protein
MKSFSEMSLPELVAYVGGTMSTPACKTIREIWNGTPAGKAIRDAGFLALGDLMNAEARTSIVRWGQVYFNGDFFGLTIPDATAAFLRWLRKTKADPVAWHEFRERENAFWGSASFSSVHPPVKL